jgi:hypothetical protein
VPTASPARQDGRSERAGQGPTIATQRLCVGSLRWLGRLRQSTAVGPSKAPMSEATGCRELGVGNRGSVNKNGVRKARCEQRYLCDHPARCHSQPAPPSTCPMGLKGCRVLPVPRAMRAAPAGESSPPTANIGGCSDDPAAGRDMSLFLRDHVGPALIR